MVLQRVRRDRVTKHSTASQRKDLFSPKNLYMSVHSSFICNTQKLTIQMSYSEWVVKPAIVRLYPEILFSSRKQWTVHINNKRQLSWVKEKMLLERLHSVWFHVHNILEITVSQKWRTDQWARVKEEWVGTNEEGALEGQCDRYLWQEYFLSHYQNEHPGVILYHGFQDFTFGRTWVKESQDFSVLFFITTSESSIRSK